MGTSTEGISAGAPSGEAVTPFDAGRLDGLLEEAGLEAIVATSPHNVRYLLGGYHFFMYEIADSIGLSRYLPAVGYRRGAPDQALYVGAGNEDWGTAIESLWIEDIRNVSWSSVETAAAVAAWATRCLPPGSRLGVEFSYLPADALGTLTRAGLSLLDSSELLETLRAVKRPHELELVRRSSRAVVDAILATFAATRIGQTKAEIFEQLRAAETTRGLTFAYALIAAGADLNRGPSARPLERGDVLSLDSGALGNGWVADLTRMGIAGDPLPRHEDLLMQVDLVQQAARACATAGTRGGEVFAAAEAAIAECEDAENLSFLAHGTGLVTHEAPRLTATGSPPYPPAHAELPLEEGMVLSIESQVADPRLGFVKLEDTVIVTADGPEAVADHGRGWNSIGG